MKSSTARRIHAAANLAGWAENSKWHPENPLAELACVAVRALPFRVDHALNSLFFDTTGLLAVSGESVVFAYGLHEVKKYMLRVPGAMSTGQFCTAVQSEVGLMTHHLAGIALPTQVSSEPARIFRSPKAEVIATVQRQRRIDLLANPPFSLERIERGSSIIASNTARSIASFLRGVADLEKEGFLPDIAPNSDILRIASDGGLLLLDVMPMYPTGTRLIGDSPPNIVPRIKRQIASLEQLEGSFGR